MKGTLQGDFSRFSFDRTRHFSAVWMQQGRVQLDSDWNEQAAIAAYRHRTGLRDLIGRSGAPAEADGFEIIAHGGLALDGVDDYVRVGGAGVGTFRSERGLTLELLFKPEPGSGVLLSRWGRAQPGDPVRNAFVLGFRADGTLALEREGRVLVDQHPGGATISWRKLQLLSLVCRPDETRIYLDGELAARYEEPCGFREAEASFHLGATFQEGSPSRCFKGFLAEFRVWSLPLSEQEIRQIRDSFDLSGGEEHLIGCWFFDRAGEKRVADATTHQNDAFLGGKDPAQRPRRVVQIAVGPGRYYVDGILCENEAEVSFTAQPSDPGEPMPQRGGHDRYLFYLEAWERTVSWNEEPEIREIALGGADTTLRSQVVAQVRAMPVAGELKLPHPEEHFGEWENLLARQQQKAELVAWLEPKSAELGNLLYRVEIHSGGAVYGTPRSEDDPFNPAVPVTSLRRTAPREQAPEPGSTAAGSTAAAPTATEKTDPAEEPVTDDHRSAEIDLAITVERWSDELGRWRPGDVVEIFAAPEKDAAEGETREAADEPAGTLGRIVALSSEDRQIFLRGARGGELQEAALKLRRIATFKWSSCNANTFYPISERAADSPVVEIAGGSRESTALQAGDWVEIIDDRALLQNLRGELVQVERFDDFSQRVTLAPTPTSALATEAARHPLLRPWDHGSRGGELIGGALVVSRKPDGEGHELEAGIHVRFLANGALEAGDYWQIASRNIVQNIVWPGDQDPQPRPPDGVAHHYAALAVLSFQTGGVELTDLRKVFQPMSTGAVSKAGDTMDGALQIRADLEVLGNARIDTVYAKLGQPGIVDTQHLVEGAVTAEKLDRTLGLVPHGGCILSPDPVPPPDYRYSGSFLSLEKPQPVWRDLVLIPGPAPSRVEVVLCGDTVYGFSDSGQVWSYDPTTATYRARQNMPHARREFSVATLDGKIYFVGGLDTVGRPSPNLFEYAPATDTWTPLANLPTGRSAFGLVACRGKLYVLGGMRRSWFGNVVTARVEAYDPTTDTWMPRRPLPHARAGLAAVALGHSILALGGERRWLFGRWGRVLSRLHQEYLTTPDRWLKERAPLPVQRRDHGAVILDDRLYMVGGTAPFGWLEDCQVYQPGADHWTAATPLPQATDAPALVALDGRLLAFGGRRAGEHQHILVQECTFSTRLYVHCCEPGAGPSSGGSSSGSTEDEPPPDEMR